MSISTSTSYPSTTVYPVRNDPPDSGDDDAYDNAISISLRIKKELRFIAGQPTPTDDILSHNQFVHELKIDFAKMDIQDDDISKIAESLHAFYQVFSSPNLPLGIIEELNWTPTPLIRFMLSKLKKKEDICSFIRLYFALEKGLNKSENEINQLIDAEIQLQECDSLSINDAKLIQIFIDEQLDLYITRLTDIDQIIGSSELIGIEFENNLLDRIKETYPLYTGTVNEIHQVFLKKINNPYLIDGILDFPMLIKENCNRFRSLKPIHFAHNIRDWIYAIENIKIEIDLLIDHINFISRNFPTQNIDLSLLDITILITLETIKVSLDSEIKPHVLKKLIILIIQKANDNSLVSNFEYSILDFIKSALPKDRACKILESQTFPDVLTKLYKEAKECRYSGLAHLSCMVDLWVTHPPLCEYWRESRVNPALINTNVISKTIENICLKLISDKGYFFVHNIFSEYQKLLPMIPYDEAEVIQIFTDIKRKWLHERARASIALQEQREHLGTDPS